MNRLHDRYIGRIGGNRSLPVIRRSRLDLLRSTSRVEPHTIKEPPLHHAVADMIPFDKQHKISPTGPLQAVANQSRSRSQHSRRRCPPVSGQGLNKSLRDFVASTLSERVQKNPIWCTMSNPHSSSLRRWFSAFPESPKDEMSNIFQTVKPPNSSLLIPPQPRSRVHSRKTDRWRCNPRLPAASFPSRVSRRSGRRFCPHLRLNKWQFSFLFPCPPTSLCQHPLPRAW